MEMETETSCTQRAPQEASNYDELFMQNTLLFADSLKDLKNLRAQLYSAAEYFELAYCRDGQEQLVVETLKDYISKAIISTVDHLGSVACKVSNFLQEKIDEVSGAELRFFCMQQKLRTCQEYIHCSGLSEQSLVIKTPKFHKEYIVPVAGKKHVATGKTGSIYQCAEHDLQQSANVLPEKAGHATRMEPPNSYLLRKWHSRLPTVGVASNSGTFAFARTASHKETGGGAVSPYRFLLRRSGSVSANSVIPNSSNSSRQRWPSEPRRSASLSANAERDRTKEIQQYSKKSKPLFKALLSIRRQNRDGRV
ncbi:protein ABIL2-like isoform X2 [Diospyros lotus]|uniref:protein ABIL2-like isoform X2 n=1 Tax=Diospyros lotus TaxID=55363 RepID=UPI0022505088|nr:protein ABIL2-like isoform X2 [Diospyros lotus]